MSQTIEQPRRFPRLNKAFFPVFIGAMMFIVGLGAIREMRATPSGASDLPFLAQRNAGEDAPAFHAQTLSGRAVNFPGDYRGKIVLVDFWATWCGPCAAEYPRLLEAYGKYHERGFEILGVSLDETKGVSVAGVEKFLKERNARWDVIYADTGTIAGEYRVSAIPTAFLVDGDTGKIIAGGNQTHGEKLLESIAAALRQ